MATLRSFAPCRGFVDLAVSPYAVGYFLPLYELEFRPLPNPNSHVPHPSESLHKKPPLSPLFGPSTNWSPIC
jgi:hypothetical protein